MEDTAVLCSFDKYTTFLSAEKRSLSVLVMDWKDMLVYDGDLEVLAKYRQRDNMIEEYIDLEPILKRLYMENNLPKTNKKCED